MIPTKNHAAVSSTLEGEAVAMTMDPAAAAHIMSIMTNMYADPEAAVIREYSTNAWDAHVAAGQTRPIEVSTPSQLRPVLVIKDFGLGLDAEDIRVTLSRYGASTKRESNDANGMLGIGCKSALAYTDQFTITGVKDGQRTVVNVARDETGAGTMTTMPGTGETDEPNGVEVAIPVQRHHSIEEKVIAFFAHWAPGTVLVDGEEPTPLEGTAIGDCLVNPTGQSHYAEASRGLIVMGNVAYPLPAEFEHSALARVNAECRIVARVDIGGIQFAPSREALLDNAATRAKLTEVFDAYEVALGEHINAKIAAAPSKAAALREVAALRSIVARIPDGLKWREALIPVNVETPVVYGPRWKGAGRNHPLGRKVLWRTYGTARGGNGRSPVNSVSALDAIEGFWVTNFTNNVWSKSMRLKLERYLETRGQDAPGNVFLTDDLQPPGGDWMDEARRVDWDDIRKWRDPATAASRESGPLSYPARECGQNVLKLFYPAEDLPGALEGGLYYYVGHKGDEIAYNGASILPSGGVVVILPSTREAKFKRLYPHAEPLAPAVEAHALKWWRALKPNVREATLEASGRELHEAAELANKLGKVADPTFKGIERLRAAYDRDIHFEYRDTYQALLGDKAGSAPGLVSEINKRYPLLRKITSWSIKGDILDHLKLYVNAAYAARKDGE